MAIKNLTRVEVGQVGVLPGTVKMVTTDNLAAVVAAGYLNSNGNVLLPSVALRASDVLEVLYDYNVSTQVGTFGFFQPTFSNGVITLNAWDSPDNVLPPVVDGHFAVYNGTSGQIKDLGYVPSNVAKTTVVMAGSAVVTGHMALFTDTAGTVDDTAATAINNGNIQAGLSGLAGTLASFPTTAANGSLIISALDAGGAFNTTIRNSAMAQSTVYSLGDIGAATGGIPVATAAIRIKSVAGAAAAGGNAAQSFSDAFCTSGSNVIGNWNTQANVASVLKIVPGNGSFVVTSSADAGVGTFNYMIIK